jgi:shikimate dehydrogenase
LSANTILNLIETGELAYATLPADNPRHLDFPSYTVPLMAHDYPAKTPVLFNSVYRALGMEVRNVMVVGDPKKTAQFLEVFRQDPRYLGGGFGVGFKETAAPLMDELDDAARASGAINFGVRNSQGRLLGYNVDGEGFAASLEAIFAKRGQQMKGTNIVCIGAGGTARSVVLALAKRGAAVTVMNRTPEKAGRLVQSINSAAGRAAAILGSPESLPQALRQADAVINTTVKGASGSLESYSALGPADLHVSPESLARNLEVSEGLLALIPATAIACDVVLAKQPTPFLQSAARRGLATMDGLPMVVAQAVEAFWILHGADAARLGGTKQKVREWMDHAVQSH